MTYREFRFNYPENVNEFYPNCKDTQECIPVGCVPPAAVSIRGVAFCRGILLWSSVMPFCYGGLLIEGGPLVESGLLLWPSGVVPSGVVAFCYGLLVERLGTPPPRRPYQKAAFNQKTTKPEGHNRMPHPPWEQTPPDQAPPWEQTPPEQTHPPCEQNSWHTAMKILPCPKLRLRVVKILSLD